MGVAIVSALITCVSAIVAYGVATRSFAKSKSREHRYKASGIFLITLFVFACGRVAMFGLGLIPTGIEMHINRAETLLGELARGLVMVANLIVPPAAGLMTMTLLVIYNARGKGAFYIYWATFVLVNLATSLSWHSIAITILLSGWLLVTASGIDRATQYQLSADAIWYEDIAEWREARKALCKARWRTALPYIITIASLCLILSTAAIMYFVGFAQGMEAVRTEYNDKLEDQKLESYDEGYEVGYEKGYDDGYDDGMEDLAEEIMSYYE